MKRGFIIALTISFLVVCKINAQVSGFVYKDALALYTQINSSSPNKATVKNIINYYFKSASVTKSTITGNPFLQKYADRVFDNMESGSNFQPSGALSGLFGANVTNFADGVAKFLIERSKQELSMAFFDRFKDDLKKYPEIETLFPKTVEILNNIENHNILNLLQELRDAFSKDLVNSPKNILALRGKDLPAKCTDGNCTTRIEKIQKVFTDNDPPTIAISLNIIQSLIDGNNIITALNRTVADEQLCKNTIPLVGYIKTILIVVESLRTDNSDGLFINEVSLRNLFESEELLSLFLGLAYEKYNKIECYQKGNLSIKANGSSLELKDIFLKVLENRNDFYGVLTSLDNINAAYKGIRSQIDNGSKIDISYYGAFATASLSVIQKLSNGIVRVTESIAADTVKFNRFFRNLNIGIDFCVDIQQRNYAGVFSDVINFVNFNDFFNDKKTKEKIVVYLSFAANLSSASNSDEVKEAINAVAFPPGSYSIKQKSSFNVSVNGYVGYNWDFNGGLYANGVYAPVGFSVSCGLGKKKGGALTLFASVIDVGAVVSYRLKNGTTDDLKQDIRLESVLAPSAQLFFEIPKTPIAFGPGWRRTSKLFYSNSMGFTVVKPKDVFSLSILIDIPIFTLKNNPYK
jgi:hypothetical protein